MFYVCRLFCLCMHAHTTSLFFSPSFSYSLEEFNLDDHDIDANTTSLMNDCSSKTHTQPVNDFGHSLFAGYVRTYMYIHVLYTVHIL